MGLAFPGSGANYVDLGDIAAARFDANLSWSFLCFFRVSTYSGSDKTLASKGSSGTDQQFRLVVEGGADPADLAYYNTQAGGARVTLANAVTGAGWFLAAVISNGNADATSITLRIFGADRVQDASGTGQGADAADQTAASRLGVLGTSTEPHDGDLDFAAYISGVELSQDECAAYAGNPHSVRSAYSSSVEHFLKLGPTGVDVVDWSVNGVGSITGSPTLTDSPPVRPFTSGQVQPTYLPPAVASAAPAVFQLLPIVHHHRMRN